jgi:hypothetical protein
MWQKVKAALAVASLLELHRPEQEPVARADLAQNGRSGSITRRGSHFFWVQLLRRNLDESTRHL